MKTANDPRHQDRIKTMQEIYAWGFNKEEKPEKQSSLKIIENIEKIDNLITEAAPAWPLEKINKIDLAVLRLAVFELVIETKAPVKVVVDEAVEIGKEYGSESSGSFINGVLGKLIEDHKIGY